MTEALVESVLGWAEANRRDLPWRRTRDPWAVLVSETMLQQTQVPRVAPRFAEFMSRFPDVGACALAPAADVIAAWSGLGYNRRAVQLHRAATVVVDRYGGVIPSDLDALLALPGVGPYTARAVSAFAFGRDVAVVDTNVGRWLARLDARTLRPAEAQRRADGLVPAGRSWEWNQAVLDLGAGLCRPSAPACHRCPASQWCRWRGVGPDPARGSAHVSRPQSRFRGSDREGAAAAVRALTAGALDDRSLAEVMGWPGDPDRVERVAAGLVRDGLAARDDRGRWVLPR